MKGLRLLNNGEWSKPPVLTAARRILIRGLAETSKLRSLGEIADFLNGTSYDAGKISEFGESPIIRISNITNPQSSYLKTSEKLDRKFLVHPGDLLVSWSASFKSIIWPGPEGYLNQHIFHVVEHDGFHRGYIRHAIEAYFDEMQDRVVGIGMLHLRRGDFLGQQIPVPPIEIQRVVSEYLDAIEFGRNDRPELPDVLQQEKRVVMRIEDLAARVKESQTIRRETLESSGKLIFAGCEAVLKEAESRYPSQELGSLVVEERGISYGIVQTGEDVSNGVPTLRAGDLRWFTCRTENIKRVAPEIEQGYKRTRLEGKELLLRIRGGFGEVAICPPDMIGGNVSREIAVIPLREILDSRFLMYLLAAPTNQSRLSQHVKGTSYVGINLKDIRTMRIPVPPLNEQLRIIAELDELRRFVDSLKLLQDETALELDALLPSILSNAFAGEL